MAIGNQITIVGNLTGDPELRYTPNGAAVATLSVAVNHRTRDQQGNWNEGEPSFFRCNVWRQQAENAAESLTKGTRVIVTGRMRQRSWEDKETGQKRSAMEIEVESVGPSLEWARANIERNPRENGGGGGGGSPAFANAGMSNGSAADEEPPF